MNGLTDLRHYSTLADNVQATINALDGAGMVAGSRADLMPLGAERNAMSAAAQRWYSLSGALFRGQEFTPEQVTTIAAEVDAEMAGAGANRLPAQADKIVAAFTG